MKLKLCAWLFILAMFTLASCDSASVAPQSQGANELDKMISQMETATIIARDLADSQARATSRADMTRQVLILSQQQTRISQEVLQTQTVFAINIHATAIAHNATQTRASEDARATTTAQTIQQTETAHAARFTATANAVIVEATRASASATATANAVIVVATRESASATATSLAANAQATRTSNDATATVIAAQVYAAQEKAEWDKRLEAGRALATFVLGTLVLVGIAVIIGFAAIRFVDAGVLRARVIRDKTGTVFVIGERDQRGRQTVLIPGRSSGAALALTPPEEKPITIDAHAVDEETTKRDQAVSLMLAATSGKPNDRADDLLAELTDSEQIKIVDEPPAQLVNGDSAQLLDGQWKLLNDGKAE